MKTNELMTTPFQIVVCGSIVPDPLQTLEPVTAAGGPALKNEMMLPAVNAQQKMLAELRGARFASRIFRRPERLERQH